MTPRGLWTRRLYCYSRTRNSSTSPSRRYGSGDERYDGARRRIGLYCGVVLLLLEIAMAVVVTITTIYPRDAAMGTIPAIAIATFTFYKLTMAIINAVKAK